MKMKRTFIKWLFCIFRSGRWHFKKPSVMCILALLRGMLLEKRLEKPHSQAPPIFCLQTKILKLGRTLGTRLVLLFLFPQARSGVIPVLHEFCSIYFGTQYRNSRSFCESGIDRQLSVSWIWPLLFALGQLGCFIARWRVYCNRRSKIRYWMKT